MFAPSSVPGVTLHVWPAPVSAKWPPGFDWLPKRRRKDGEDEKTDVPDRCVDCGSGHVARGECTGKDSGQQAHGQRGPRHVEIPRGTNGLQGRAGSAGQRAHCRGHRRVQEGHGARCRLRAGPRLPGFGDAGKRGDEGARAWQRAGGEAASKPTAKEVPVTSKSPEALTAFKDARDLLDNVRTAEAIVGFKKAMELDADFAQAHAYLGSVTPGSEGMKELERGSALAAKLPASPRPKRSPSRRNPPRH